ncbi:MAG: hypothetical protein AABW86_05790 [Candidatus Micrarchaeota archaeon]
MNNLDFCVRYPFSNAAKELLEKEGISPTPEIMDKGLARLKSALSGKWMKSTAVHDSEKLAEVASYAVARMILSYMRNRYLTNKFAVAEAKLAHSFFEKEGDGALGAISEELGIKIKNENKTLFVPLPSYLKFSPRSIDYKLVNRSVSNGFVSVNPHERRRLMEEAVRKKAGEIPQLRSGVPDSIKKAAENLKADLPKIEPQRAVTFKEGDNPPCIEKLLESLRKHENLNHQSRWALAVYLSARGMSAERIVSLYSNLPDFNEKITKYQVEHIKKRGYSVPSCATLLSYGICCAECRIGSPLNWRGKTRGSGTT